MVLNLRIRLHLGFILAESVLRQKVSVFGVIASFDLSVCHVFLLSVASSISATRLGRRAWLWATSDVCAEQETEKCKAMNHMNL